jgi:hypothetical protein
LDQLKKFLDSKNPLKVEVKLGMRIVLAVLTAKEKLTQQFLKGLLVDHLMEGTLQDFYKGTKEVIE